MEKHIIFFQENTSDIMNLAAELTDSELGLYMRLKATYIKYGGVVPIKMLKKYSGYQGGSSKLQKIVEKVFKINGDLYSNLVWDLELKRIKNISEKARDAVNSRWKKRDAEQAKWESYKKDAGIEADTDVDTNVDTKAYTNYKLRIKNREPLNNTPNNKIIKPPLPPKKRKGGFKSFKRGK